MIRIDFRHRLVVHCLAIPLLVLVAAGSHASGQFVWDGGANIDNLFASDDNWSGGTAPGMVVGAALQFGLDGGGDYLVTNIDLAYTSVAGLSFTGLAGAYTLSGIGSLAIDSGLGITNSSGNLQTLNVNIVGMGTDLMLNAAAGGLTLGGGIDLSDTMGVQLTISGTGMTTISGSISGAGGSLVKNDAGTLLLSGTNTYDGTTTINAGTVQLNGGAAILDTGAVVLADAAGAQLELLASETIGSLSGGGATGGNVVLNANTLTIAETGTATFAGILSGAGGIVKEGAGTLTLTGTNTHTGTTRVNGGVLQVSGGNAIADTGLVAIGDIAGATFELLADETVGSLSGGGPTGGTINLNASTLTVNQAIVAMTNTYSGSIIGTGGFTKMGSGTIALGGTNTYTGTTTVGAGTLQLTGGNAILDTGVVNLLDVAGAQLELVTSETIGSLQGGGTTGGFIRLNAGANLTINEMGMQTYGGTINGDGGIIKGGTGTLTLGGINGFVSAAVVNAGTLRLTGGNAILNTTPVMIADVAGATLELMSSETIGGLSGGGSTGGVVNLGASTLTVNQSGTGSFAGTITGTGVLEHTGSGTLFLSGTNTYSGGTVFSGLAGTLALGSDGALSTGPLALTAVGTLMPANGPRTITNDLAFSVTDFAMAGSDAVNYTGAVTLGGLPLSLNVIASAPVTFSGVMSNGSFTKTGAGTVILAGANTYAGDTTVSAGLLRLDGSVAGSARVTGGTFAGTGTVGGNLTNESGGRITPGAGVGTLNVTGNYTQNSGSVLAVDVNAQNGASDVLAIGGAATLNAGSTIDATIASASFITPGRSWTVLTAGGGITDLGTAITTSSATMSFTLQRDDAFVNGATSYTLEAFRAANAFTNAATPGNNTVMGIALDSLVPIANANPTGEVAGLLGRLDMLDATTINTAYQELSPERTNAITTMAIDGATAFTSTQASYLAAKRSGAEALAMQAGMDASRLASGANDPRLLAAAIGVQDEAFRRSMTQEPTGVYARLFGVFSDQDTVGNRTGYQGLAFGVQAGIDHRFTPELVVGISGGFLEGEADLAGGAGELDTQSFRVGPYLSYAADDWYLDASLTAGFSEHDNERRMPTLGLTALAEYDGNDVTGYVGVGHEMEIDNAWTITPTFSLQYAYFEYDGYSETNAGGANLVVPDRDSDSLRTRLGLILAHQLSGGSSPLFADVTFAWEHEYLDNDDVAAAFAGGGNAFTVDTGVRESDSFVFGTGFSLRMQRSSTAYLRYEGLVSSTTDSHAVSAGVSWRF